MPDPVLCLENLTVRYGDFIAVDGLDLALRPGELFGLLGPNGAGKSSTLRVLIGQRKPTAGRATLAGLDVVRDWQKVKPLFGYVPDRENHFEEFSGLRNLHFFAELYGVDARRVEECLALVELTEAGKLPVKAYSLGMRRKLLLARALLHRPRVLYLDEPSANLDIHSIEVVHRILRALTADGTTVLMTTHNMPEVEQVCDRVAILCKGRPGLHLALEYHGPRMLHASLTGSVLWYHWLHLLAAAALAVAWAMVAGVLFRRRGWQ